MAKNAILEKYRCSPDILYGELFREVQTKRIYPDTKTFVDSVPRVHPEEIVQRYQQEKTRPTFDLSQFVEEYFHVPDSPAKHFHSDITMSTVDHIKRLWDVLSRPADQEREGSSRIPLPFPYVVPGGRFREIFYWDSYFTMLGLSVFPNRFSLIQNMIDNFAYLIDSFGFIPNGNRSYFLSRSQPPFFACMIQLLAELSENPTSIRRKYLPQLEKEYQFWMNGQDQLKESTMFRQVCRNKELTIFWIGVSRALIPSHFIVACGSFIGWYYLESLLGSTGHSTAGILPERDGGM